MIVRNFCSATYVETMARDRQKIQQIHRTYRCSKLHSIMKRLGMVWYKVRWECSAAFTIACVVRHRTAYVIHMGFLYWKPFKPQISLMRKLFWFTLYPYAIRTRAFLLSSVDILQAQYGGIMQRTVSQSINQNKLYRAGPIASSVAWQGGE